MQLIPWSHPCREGFTLRGLRSEPSGKPLLHFLHGNGFCAMAYRPMLALLAESFDLWLSDVQGHGDSDHGGPFLGWNRTAQLAAEAFEAGLGTYGAVPRYALGHSFGAVLTCLILAERPQLFAGAVLLDPVLFTPSMIGSLNVLSVLGLSRRHSLARKAATRRRHWPDRAAAKAALAHRGIFKGWCDDALAAYIEYGLKDDGQGVALKCAPEREVEIFGSVPRRLWHSLGQIRTPSLVIHGRDSYPYVARSIKRWAAINPRLSTLVVDGQHCFMQVNPAESAGAVAAFLRKHSG
ncbi:alpha/beta fold hydrolase [Pseudomonas sessilinigenes]|uniref:Alpha/beta hydrolase n=1 Tax=Pseudomonas sessilinigenes TaxID=658629 RepID=A0ABX8MYZ2_9PSED|nr:alpha/beta hydrolase [Pseudomonas sessilinigenes]AZC23988.1 Hydrolase, alpha/beta fold family [Pseudomonas sessilinigenes]QXH42955.1 alpha/beta hydrolase [Pseudomonas sessilinigenes]